MRIKALAQVSVALLLPGCIEGTEISRDSFEASGKTWPLTVESGSISCMRGSAVFFEDSEGRRFSVNGTARDHEPNLPHLDEITAVDETFLRMIRAAGDTNPFEPRLDTQEIINLGLSVC